MSIRWLRILSALAGIAGTIMIGLSFGINPGPPDNATAAQLSAFSREWYASVLWGAWLQAVGPALIILFALAVVFLADATTRLSGWMTMFGASVLMTVSLIEITFYIGALEGGSAQIGLVSLGLIHAVQHLYFAVAAPALFLPLGIVILGSSVLPRVLGYLALALGAAFAALGVAFVLTLTLPGWVLAFGSIQSIWWLAAAVTLIVRTLTGPSRSRVLEPAPERV
jgi:hypothetical protein